MKKLILLFFSSLVLPVISLAYDGNDLLADCNEFVSTSSAFQESNGDHNFLAGVCLGYIQGVAEIHYMLATAKANHPDSKDPDYSKKIASASAFCIPEGVKNVQIAKIIIKYLNDHPEELNQLPTEIILEAEEKYFPCSKTNE